VPAHPPAVRALLFDVFGTLVDWRSSVLAQARAFGLRRGVTCDWEALVDAWRGAYYPSMDRVRSGELPWRNLDALHAASFEDLCSSFGIEASLSAEDRAWFVRRWHDLDPWSDVRAGLVRLRERHVLATLSNGNVSLLVDLAKNADLRFDAILSAEIFRRYKPDPETYLGAAALLGCEPRDVMLVAAHNDDLLAARAQGLRTAFVARATEYGPHQKEDFDADARIDVVARDLIDLAERLEGAENDRRERYR
jgi:2-haloacid dehalogenase